MRKIIAGGAIALAAVGTIAFGGGIASAAPPAPSVENLNQDGSFNPNLDEGFLNEVRGGHRGGGGHHGGWNNRHRGGWNGWNGWGRDIDLGSVFL